ncbi:MAG: hypothetical protein U7123_03430 [Potamolinea sp.]
MITKFIQKLGITRAITTVQLTDTDSASNSENATVNFSYQGLTPQQTINGSFSCDANLLASVVTWNDLTKLTISYNGGPQKSQLELENLFALVELSYYLSDVTFNYGEPIKAGSFYCRLSNDCEMIEYTYAPCSESYDRYAVVSSSNGYWRAEEMLDYRQTYSSATATIANVGIWLVEKVSGSLM